MSQTANGALGDFPDITLIDVDLSGLREVEIFGPGMAVVVDEFYGPVSAVFTAVEDVFTSNVPQDGWSQEDLFQLSYVIDRGAGFVDSLFPLLDLLSPCGCESMTSQSALKVLHNSLSHTVEVAGSGSLMG